MASPKREEGFIEEFAFKILHINFARTGDREDSKAKPSACLLNGKILFVTDMYE